MKNLKVIFSLVPVLGLASFIYFTTIGFSAGTEGKAIQGIKKPSNTVMLWISLTDSGGNHCFTGTYEYCINGGHGIYETTEGFYAEVPCGETFTICVTSGNCHGRYTGIAACDTDTYRIIDLSPENKPCACD